jgi:hypothetical protein
VRLAGWSDKDELNEIVDELSLDTHVEGQVTGHVQAGEEMEMEVKKYSG